MDTLFLIVAVILLGAGAVLAGVGKMWALCLGLAGLAVFVATFVPELSKG